MKMIDLNCPKCGATINPDMEKGRCECKYCGHQMLIEKEDTLEAIAAKAQSKSYGYHKGKLQAEAEAGIIREGTANQKKNIPTLLLILIVLIIIGVAVVIISNFAKPKVNPFDCIEVSFKGTDGDGEVVIKMVGQDDVDPNRIDYDVSKYSDLSQGDTISILATSSDYRLTEKSKTYVVEGLDTYLADLEYPEESIGEETFSKVVEEEAYTNDEVEDSISIKENEQLQDCLVYGGEYSFDLDGDGTEESLCLRYNGENGTYCDVEITINGETFMEIFGALSTKGYYVTDIDENSPGLEIAIYDFGDSDDPAMHFYTYDGGLNYIGLVYFMNVAQYTLKDNILIGFGGRIEGEISAYVFYTCYATAQWEYSYAEKTINMIEQEMYQMKEDGPYELTEDIKIYKSRSTDSELITLKAQNIYFIESDGESWMKVKGEDGVTGYLHRNEKWEIDSVGKRAEEIITNLRFAG